MSDFLDDSFWDSGPSLAYAIPAKAKQAKPLISKAFRPDSAIAEYHKALVAFFPNTTVNVLPHPTPMSERESVSTAILGSNIIQVDDKGSAQWYQTLESKPINLLEWLEARQTPPHMPATHAYHKLEDRDCKSPADFRVWLNKVAYHIMQTQSALLRSALHQDNFIKDTRLTLQCAYDLHMVRANPTHVVGATPPPTWATSPRTKSFAVKLFRTPSANGTTITVGTVFLVWDQGKWVHGIDFNPEALWPNTPAKREKFKGSSPFTETDVALAQEAAWHFVCAEVYNWLARTAVAYPKHRGAS